MRTDALKGQATVEFLIVGSIVAALLFVGVQMGALLLKTDLLQWAAFWAGRVDCVGGDAEGAGLKAFGREPLSDGIQVEADGGLAKVSYEVRSGAFPVLCRWLGTGEAAGVHLRGTSYVFPDPGGPDGDN